MLAFKLLCHVALSAIMQRHFASATLYPDVEGSGTQAHIGIPLGGDEEINADQAQYTQFPYYGAAGLHAGNYVNNNGERRPLDYETEVATKKYEEPPPVPPPPPPPPPMCEIVFKFYYVKDEFVPYPMSKSQYKMGLIPAMMEASVFVDLERKWLSKQLYENDKNNGIIFFKDNAKVKMDFDKILLQQNLHVANMLNSQLINPFDQNDEWALQLCTFHKNWITKAKDRPFEYLKQLINYSVMGRTVLLYISLHNATFGMRHTDKDDLNEIMVTITSREREAIKEYHKKLKTDYNQNVSRASNQHIFLCDHLVNDEKELKLRKHYKLLIQSLCTNDRDQIFMPDEQHPKNNYGTEGNNGLSYKYEDLKEDAILFNEFVKTCEEGSNSALEKFWEQTHPSGNKANDTNGNRIIRMLTWDNYERLRFVLKTNSNFISQIDYALLKAKKSALQADLHNTNLYNVLSLVRMICIDTLYGRPYLMAILLREKLETLYCIDKEKDYSDAFNDVSRIFLLRGPVDIADIFDVYSDASNKSYKLKESKKLPDNDPNELFSKQLLFIHLQMIKQKFGFKNQDKFATIEGYEEILKWLVEKAENWDGINKNKKAHEIIRNYDLVIYTQKNGRRYKELPTKQNKRDHVIVKKDKHDKLSFGIKDGYSKYEAYQQYLIKKAEMSNVESADDTHGKAQNIVDPATVAAVQNPPVYYAPNQQANFCTPGYVPPSHGYGYSPAPSYGAAYDVHPGHLVTHANHPQADYGHGQNIEVNHGQPQQGPYNHSGYYYPHANPYPSPAPY